MAALPVLPDRQQRRVGWRVGAIPCRGNAPVLLLDEGPVIPIYHYSTNELVKPYVRGIYRTALDIHPLTHVWIDHDWQKNPQPVAAGDARAPGSDR